MDAIFRVGVAILDLGRPPGCRWVYMDEAAKALVGLPAELRRVPPEDLPAHQVIGSDGSPVRPCYELEGLGPNLSLVSIQAFRWGRRLPWSWTKVESFISAERPDQAFRLFRTVDPEIAERRTARIRGFDCEACSTFTTAVAECDRCGLTTCLECWLDHSPCGMSRRTARFREVATCPRSGALVPSAAGATSADLEAWCRRRPAGEACFPECVSALRALGEAPKGTG